MCVLHEACSVDTTPVYRSAQALSATAVLLDALSERERERERRTFGYYTHWRLVCCTNSFGPCSMELHLEQAIVVYKDDPVRKVGVPRGIVATRTHAKFTFPSFFRFVCLAFEVPAEQEL